MKNQTERRPRKGTYRFLVSGPVPGFRNEIREWTSEMNEAQALKQVALRLQKRHPGVRIYLGNCTVTLGKEA
ncbi:MAG: hypothetical protein WAP23_03350 [Candidatus Spechtbacterales bacterium]